MVTIGADVVCRKCGGMARWMQRRNGTPYLGISNAALRLMNDGSVPGSYIRKVANRPHVCGETPEQKRTNRANYLMDQMPLLRAAAAEGLPPGRTADTFADLIDDRQAEVFELLEGLR
jgi:hypothetical protein